MYNNLSKYIYWEKQTDIPIKGGDFAPCICGHATSYRILISLMENHCIDQLVFLFESLYDMG